MTDTQTAYRSHYRASGEDIHLRDSEELEDDDGVFEIRLPIASTGEVRNEGDDPLTRDELSGMARQLQDRQIGVFPAHGSDTKIAGSQYSPFERLGDWRDADIETRDDGDTDVLMATARMPDPETLPAATGSYREGLAILKEQAERGISQDASIGWRDDEEFPGGVDLMEASIVGIGADWRTNTGNQEADVGLVARAAVDAGADPDELVSTVRAAVRESDAHDHRYAGEGTMEIAEGPTLSRGELYCGPTDSVHHFGAPVSEMECPGCGRVLDGVEMVADLQSAEDSDVSMTDTDTPDDDGGTTEEQDASDGETDERAPDDVGAAGFNEFVASHYDGVDAADVTDALDEAGGSYIGEVDVPELAALVADVTDSDTGTVQDAMDDLMGESQETDEDDDDNEQAADGEDVETDAEQSADVDDDDDASDLEERLASLEEELAEARDGGLTEDDVDTPDSEGDEAPDEDRDADEDSAEDTTAGVDTLGEYR